MTASIHLQSISNGETIAQGITVFAPISSSVETSGTQSKSVTKIREAGTFDLAFVRASVNTLSGACTVTLRKNGVDTAVTLSISAAATGAFHDTTNDFSVAAGDEVGWAISTASGSGSITLIQLGFRFTPTNTSNCVSFLSCFGASSSGYSTLSTTWFQAPQGSRLVETTESDCQQRIQRAASWRGFYAVQGTNDRTADTFLGCRVNGADDATLEATVPGLSTAVVEDNVGSISLAADDLFNYYVRTNGSGSGIYNLERINTELVSTEGKFFLFIASPAGMSLDSERFFALSGEGSQFVSEANAEFVAKSSFRLSQLIVNVMSSVSVTQNGATIRVRKNGADTDLAVRINGQIGSFQDYVHFVDIEPDDTVCVQFDDPSGTVTVQSIGLVGDVTGAGGGGDPVSTPIAWDASTDLGAFTTTSPVTGTHRPSKVNPQAVVVSILQADSTDRVSAVTYGGVSMSRLPTDGFAIDAAGEPIATYAYVLLSGIPEGNQTVSITHDGNAVAKRAFCLTFRADADLEVVDSGMVQGDVDDPGVALDSAARTAVRFYAMMSGLGNPTNVTPKSGYTQVGDVGIGTSRVLNAGYQTTAGAGTSTAGVDTSAADDVALVALALAEVEGAGTTEEVTHTTDALLTSTFEVWHTSDALLEEEQSRTHTTDSRIWATPSRTHTSNSLLEKTLTADHTTDAIIQTASASEVIFEDSFSEPTADTLLQDHTPDIGSAWVKIGIHDLEAVFLNDRMRGAGGVIFGSSNARYGCTPLATELNIDVSIRVSVPHPGGTGHDDPWMMFARGSDVDNWYSAGSYQNDKANNVRIFKNVSGTKTKIAEASFPIVTDDLVTMEVRGPVTATVVRVLVNGSPVCTAPAQNEPTLTGMNYGFGLGNNWDVATDDFNVLWAFDDFQVTQYAAEQEISKAHTTNALLEKASNKTHTTDADIRRQRLHRTDSLLAVPTVESIVFRDTFTEPTSDTGLSLHTPDEGTSWIVLGTQGLFVESGSNVVRASATVASSQAFYGCNPLATAESVDVFITVRVSPSGQPGGTDDPFMLFARISGTSSGAWYSAGCYQNTNASNLRIVKSVDGIRTEIASGHQNLALNDEIRLRVRGPTTATVVSLLINGVEVLTAPVQNEPTISSNRGGFGLGNNWTNVNDDVNQSWLFDNFQISQFSEDIERERSHTTDSLIEKVFEKPHTTNALLEKPSNKTHTTNSLLATVAAEPTRTHTTDAELWQEVTPITGPGPMGLPIPARPTIASAPVEIDELHQTNAFLRKETNRTHTTTALLKKALELQHTADGSLTTAPIVTHPTDALIKRAQTVAHGTNALTAPAAALAHQTDAFVIITAQIQHQTESLIKAAMGLTHTADAVLVLVSLRNVPHVTDSLIEAIREREHSSDALIRLDGTAAHQVDALIQSVLTVSQDTDGFLRISVSSTHTADSFLKDTDDVTHSTSALLDDATSEHHGTDAALAGTPEVAHSADSFTVSLGALTHTGDAFIRKSADLDQETDALLKMEVSLEHVTDALVLRALSLDHETDAGIWWIQDVIHVTDAVLLFPQVGHGTDAFLRMGLQTPKEGIVRSLNPILTVRKL